MIETILKENWIDYRTDLAPIDRRMRILDDVRGMSTENIRFLFNEIVKRIGGTYLEVGIWRGCSLLSAALWNSARCIGIDNFSEFNYGPDGKFDERPEEELKKNLARFPVENTEWYKGDYREVIKNLKDLRVDVYFYDGNHSYENQTEGLRIMLPYLSKECVIIVDDINWEQVERANNDFIKENPFKSVLKIKTEGNQSKGWWNGIEILTNAKS